MTKVLIHSNGPTVSTGYGVQTAMLARRLKAAGHHVAISCTYGQQGSVGSWATPHGPVRLYPVGYEVNSNDVLHAHAQHFLMEGEDPGVEALRSGWIIPLLDVWCLETPMLAEMNMAAWAPVDHSPVPPGVLKFFRRNPEAIPIAMSRFGEREFFAAGLNPAYVPLSVDTGKFKPTPLFDTAAGPVPCRKVFGIPDDAFVVGMVGMNKGWAKDRKGFNEAFRAFSVLRQHHQNAILFMHAEKFGAAEGINLVDLALACGIPEHAIVWSDQYAYRLGIPSEMMAAAYSSMDVLLAPSHGEGFCVPMIEAQACGTPVIATDFSAQAELVGAGWHVTGQPEWDAAQKSNYVVPFIHEIVHALEACYERPAVEVAKMSAQAVTFAAQYDADRVFDTFWVPLLERMEKIQHGGGILPLDRPEMTSVDVIVPLMRAGNEERFTRSLADTAPPDTGIIIGSEGRTYAENVNDCYRRSTAEWILVVGDDTEFKPGWFEAARKLSTRFDVIGTNDTDGPPRHPDIAAGRHADHFFIRKAYIDEYGASLDGPGIVMAEAYGHWYTDKETVELAKARKVWSPCLDSVIVHHHPGYDLDEAARLADPVYAKALVTADADKATWLARLPLIQMQRA